MAVKSEAVGKGNVRVITVRNVKVDYTYVERCFVILGSERDVQKF